MPLSFFFPSPSCGKHFLLPRSKERRGQGGQLPHFPRCASPHESPPKALMSLYDAGRKDGGDYSIFSPLFPPPRLYFIFFPSVACCSFSSFFQSCHRRRAEAFACFFSELSSRQNRICRYAPLSFPSFSCAIESLSRRVQCRLPLSPFLSSPPRSFTGLFIDEAPRMDRSTHASISRSQTGALREDLIPSSITAPQV